MFRSTYFRPALVACACALVLTVSTSAFAQVLSNSDQTCVNALNKAGQKVGASQGKDNTSCIKDDGNGKLGVLTADDCLTEDRKGKVAKAELKTGDSETKKCSSVPPYGKTNAATVNTAAKGEELSLVFDVFGPTLDTVILTDSDGKACQATVSKTYEKYAATYVKEYNSCKKTRMKDGTIMNEPGMEACLGVDAKGKITKASDKMLDGLDKKCVGVTLATAFPGECVAAAGANNTFRDCVRAAATCHMCLAVNDMDAIARGCDTLDDGLLNATCRECGNSATEAPETCDDGGESATCDTDCTNATCGDLTVNATAGETCDDGNVSDNDPCPTTCDTAICGDGFICNLAGCTTGPTGGNEECDNAGLNSDVTPDACRTDCANPSCGDGVIDTGEDCDDSGESATCNADCTTATCGDGVENTTAGEECDDGNVSNNDSCLNSCDDAECGDGIICNAGGCTSGPSGGIEQCDNAGLNSNVNPDACRLSCANPSCGDTVVDTGEQCDAGGETVSCDTNCTFATCGDGTTNAAAGEDCDDSGESATCNADCTDSDCGDGTLNVTAGEECDDGDTTPGDGCNATCLCGLGSGEVGCNDPLCPNKAELVLYAGTRGTACSSNTDCGGFGECDTGLGRCTTTSSLDTGYTGIAHDADIVDEAATLADILCEGPFAGGPEPCGECQVLGVNPDPGYCRCANDNRTICDQPFVADADDCGGQVCNCYFGVPLPLSSGNTPACVVNQFREDIVGTTNVDLGSGETAVRLASVVYLGITTLEPCPSCGGTCTAPAGNVGDSCSLDIHCDTTAGIGDGVCANFDPTPNDGIRGGTCRNGVNDGLTCDAGSRHESFPAPGGAAHSLDCFPSPGVNVSGTGLRIDLDQSTGIQSLPSLLSCGPGGIFDCPCSRCSGNAQVTCKSDADCAAEAAGTCTNVSGLIPLPNSCATNNVCLDVGGGEGECDLGPTDKSCDGITRVDGEGFLSCTNNADCASLPNGIGGLCTITKPRECFLDPIVAQGAADPEFPIGAATFCIAQTGNGGINTVAGLPGPGRVVNQGAVTYFCASDPGTNYTPGVGGCP